LVKSAQIGAALVLLCLLFLSDEAYTAVAAGDPLALSRFSLDLDPFGSGPGRTANTATSVGELEIAGTINENGVLDADEDVVDGIQIDVVTWYDGVPAGNPLTAYEYVLNYPTSSLRVTSQVPGLIATNPGSSVSTSSDSLPDSDGQFHASVADAGPIPGSSESGEGVLDSLIVEAVPGAVSGTWFVTLSDMFATGTDGVPRAPNFSDGIIGIGINTPFGFDDYDSKILDLSVSLPATVTAGQNTGFAADSVSHVSGAPFDQDVTVTTTVTAPPDCTVDGSGPGGDHVSQATLLATPLNTAAPHHEQHDLRCVSPGAQTLTVEVCATIVSPEINGTNDCTSMDTGFTVEMSSLVDSDSDGVIDAAEYACGADFLWASERPERVDGAFSGVSDDGDVDIDEALPGGAIGFDCDGDGYTGAQEDHVYSYVGQTDGDQKTCQEYDLSHPNPNADIKPSLRWPSDFNKYQGVLDSFNRIDVLDLTSFMAPVRYIGTDVSTNPSDVRWDLRPGPEIFGTDINVADLTALIAPGASTGAPPMLGGVRAMGGPVCPWPP
jgi:hypothetical protein